VKYELKSYIQVDYTLILVFKGLYSIQYCS